jgi:hypothetical protein
VNLRTSRTPVCICIFSEGEIYDVLESHTHLAEKYTQSFVALALRAPTFFTYDCTCGANKFAFMQLALSAAKDLQPQGVIKRM